MPTVSERQLLIQEILHVVNDLEDVSRMALDSDGDEMQPDHDSSVSSSSSSSSSSSQASTSSSTSESSSSEGIISDGTDYTVQGQGLAPLAPGPARPDPNRARVGPDF